MPPRTQWLLRLLAPFDLSMQNKLRTQADTREMGDLRIGIAVSRYHPEITGSMRDAAVDAFVKAGGEASNLLIVPVPGSFELPCICRALATLKITSGKTTSGRPGLDAVIAIGCVIAGETAHDRYIADAVTQGLTAVMVETGMPIAFGVLTCGTLDQARARSIDAAASGGVNKGAEAMMAAIESAQTLQMIEHIAVERTH